MQRKIEEDLNVLYYNYDAITNIDDLANMDYY